jgi:NADH:ubiquinone oxidoreductase subunit 3 (subunit A)
VTKVTGRDGEVYHERDTVSKHLRFSARVLCVLLSVMLQCARFAPDFCRLALAPIIIRPSPCAPTVGARPKGGLTVLSQYAFIGIFAIIAFALPVIGLVISWLLRPKKPNPAKNATYECGMETIGDTWVQFKAQYYLYALVFVVFDVEAVFLFPWAVAYSKLGLYALVEMVLFVLILLGGLLYAWQKKALEWH